METPKSLETLINDAKQLFSEIFGETPLFCSYAAGRVNLIGEHTDYNDGFVMPMAIPLYTVFVGVPSYNDRSHLFSTSASANENLVEFDIHDLDLDQHPKWCRYVLGVLALRKAPIPNFVALIHSSVPLGGGLSSSASLEMATLKFIECFLAESPDDSPNNSHHLGKTEAALLCQKAEHVYANVPCGIMDQFSCALSKKDNAMLLDCRNLNYEYLPLIDPETVILVINSNVKHDLSTSAYAERRKTCLESARILEKSSLRDVSVDDLISAEKILDPISFKRVKHVVTEIRRTSDAGNSLKEHDYKKFGVLMNQSHYSLRDDYEVSCAELDQLQKLAISCPGVYGSRMTGGGFGGCTVTLLRRDAVEHVCQEIKCKYSGNATFYIYTAVQGCGSMEIL